MINEESGYAYSVGSSGGGTTCGGGLHMIDIREPKQPKFAGCFADNQTGLAGTGYSHDAQCVTYKGPDKRYKGKEICIGSNENCDLDRRRDRQERAEGALARQLPERGVHAPGLADRGSPVLLPGRRGRRGVGHW